PDPRERETGSKAKRTPSLRAESPAEADGVSGGGPEGRTAQTASAGDAPAGRLVRLEQRGSYEGVGNNRQATTAVRRSRARDAQKDRATDDGGPERRQPAGDRAEDQEDPQ